MSVVVPELEVLEGSAHSLRYLEHGWPDPLCRWHAHKECELHLILETRGTAFVGDYIGVFAPKSLFLTGPNLPHNWVTDEFWEGPVAERDMVIQFDLDLYTPLLRGLSEFRHVQAMMDRSSEGIEFFSFDFDWVKEQFANVRDTKGAAKILAFMSLLNYAADLDNFQTLSVSQRVQSPSSSKHTRIGEVIDYIVNNFAEEFSVQRAADMAGMTQATFSRNFQTVTGHRFVEFVNRVRIGEACGLLYASDDPVTTICYQVGFQNLANFNRHFLKMKGMTPTTYRETARKELASSKETV